MTAPANPHRGEARLGAITLRPSFAALVAAEEELGPLFALVDRAADGQLRLAEMATLFWHCRRTGPDDRAAFCEAVATAGLVAATPVLRGLLRQILAGQ